MFHHSKIQSTMALSEVDSEKNYIRYERVWRGVLGTPRIDREERDWRTTWRTC